MSRRGWWRPTSTDTPVVVITAFGSLETAGGGDPRAGAYDFVTKPLEIEAIGLTLGRAVSYHRLRAEVRRLRLAADTSGDPDETGLAGTPLVGCSPAMRRDVRHLAARRGHRGDGA